MTRSTKAGYISLDCLLFCLAHVLSPIGLDQV
jgi:hypothetical protein